MRVRGYLWLLQTLGIIQHGHRKSAVSAVGALEDDPEDCDPTPDSSLTNTEDRGHRERKDTSCHTISGPDIGSPCIFPFIFEEEIHLSCLDNEEGQKWCDTKMNSTEDSGWGYCN